MYYETVDFGYKFMIFALFIFNLKISKNPVSFILRDIYN
jgi:hypothetical protein